MNQKTMMILGVIVLGAALILGTKTYLAHLEPSLQNAKQQATAELPIPMKETDIQALVAKVSTHIEVKQGEVPTVATVQDAEVLRAQNPGFYKDATTGDKLLIWSDKAVLYSPTKDRLLAVLPMSLPPKTTGDASAQGAATSTASNVPVSEAEITIEVRNGSGNVGMGKAMAEKLKAKGLKVVAVRDAKSKTLYNETLLIQTKGGSTVVDAVLTVQKLEEVTGKKLSGSIPAAEGDQGSTSARVLVIVGKDFTP